MKINLESLVRPNILRLKPYSSARNEYKGEATVLLDANENPYNAPYNRYPDPLQIKVKERLAEQKGVSAEQIFLGVGSDEGIDLAYRIFCRPGVDNVVALAPTYGMYEVCADINDVEYRKVMLDENFEFSPNEVLDAVDGNTKLIWICSPNNPTGNAAPIERIVEVSAAFGGIVIVDEAYGDFSDEESMVSRLSEFPNVIVLQTFSKAWGRAGLRLGVAYASKEIIELYNKVKYPYNVNALTQEKALEALERGDEVEKWVAKLKANRKTLVADLGGLEIVEQIYASDANFVLVRVQDADGLYRYLRDRGIIVRNRNSVEKCLGCLRITVGREEENELLIKTMKEYEGEDA